MRPFWALVSLERERGLTHRRVVRLGLMAAMVAFGLWVFLSDGRMFQGLDYLQFLGVLVVLLPAVFALQAVEAIFLFPFSLPIAASLAMGSWAGQREDGTLRWVCSLPLTHGQIVQAKLLAALSVVAPYVLLRVLGTTMRDFFPFASSRSHVPWLTPWSIPLEIGLLMLVLGVGFWCSATSATMRGSWRRFLRWFPFLTILVLASFLACGLSWQAAWGSGWLPLAMGVVGLVLGTVFLFITTQSLRNGFADLPWKKSGPGLMGWSAIAAAVLLAAALGAIPFAIFGGPGKDLHDLGAGFKLGFQEPLSLRTTSIRLPVVRSSDGHTSHPVRVLVHRDIVFTHPPSGQALALEGSSSFGMGDRWVWIDRQGNSRVLDLRRRLGEGSEHRIQPIGWSPDGQHFAWMIQTSRSPGRNLYLGRFVVWSSGPKLRSPRWSAAELLANLSDTEVLWLDGRRLLTRPTSGGFDSEKPWRILDLADSPPAWEDFNPPEMPWELAIQELGFDYSTLREELSDQFGGDPPEKAPWELALGDWEERILAPPTLRSLRLGEAPLVCRNGGTERTSAVLAPLGAAGPNEEAVGRLRTTARYCRAVGSTLDGALVWSDHGSTHRVWMLEPGPGSSAKVVCEARSGLRPGHYTHFVGATEDWLVWRMRQDSLEIQGPHRSPDMQGPHRFLLWACHPPSGRVRTVQPPLEFFLDASPIAQRALPYLEPRSDH